MVQCHVKNSKDFSNTKRLFLFLFYFLLFQQVTFTLCYNFIYVSSKPTFQSYSDAKQFKQSIPISLNSSLINTYYSDNIVQFAASIPDRDLLNRIASSDLIIVGKVTDIKLVEQSRRMPVSEHDPQWSRAIVHVEGIKKGVVMEEKDVTVFFPASLDVMWYFYPKFHNGQEGIFILHRQNIPELNLVGYTALKPLDVQSLNEIDRISTLISESKA